MFRTIAFCALLALAAAAPSDRSLIPQPSNDLKCSLCEEVVAIAEKELAKNGTEQAIVNGVQQICGVLEKIPGIESTVAALCGAVEDNIDYIIQLLESEFTPEQVCKLINLCANTNPVVVAPPRMVVKVGDSCTTCTGIVDFIEAELQKNATETAIANAVGMVCNVLSGTELYEECKFVQDNIATVIGLVVSEVTPKEICSLVGQCSKNGQSLSRPLPKLSRKALKADNCDTCKELVQLAEFELEQNATQAKIKDLIDSACSFIEKYLPVQEECQMIEDNLADIISELVNQVSPEEICTLAGQCNGKAVPAIIAAAKAKHMA